MPARLALCDLGAPGWGEPWFPHSAVLLYSHLGTAMSVMFVFSVLPLLYLPYQYRWWYKDITLTHYRGYITGLPATFPLFGLFCVCFGLFCLCVLFFGLFCFSVFVMWRNCDGIGLCNGPPPVSFCGHSISRRPSLQSRVQPVSTEDLRTDDTSCPSRTYADHFMSQDHSHWPFRIWALWCHFVTTCWQPFRWTLWWHQDEDDWKSTTERILSVPWAPLYCLLVFTSHPRSFSPPLSLVSHHFSCYTALSLLASKWCFGLCELSCLMACSMWSRGSWLGGSLVSA